VPSLADLLAPGALEAEFQPVFDVSSPRLPIRYLEGLVRGPRGSDLVRPERLFAHARRLRAEGEIDRACVRAVLAAACQALLRSLLALGREVGASVVAEGLEDPEDLAFVRGAGVTLLQGYLLGRPGRCDSWPRAA
jgi:EAL domain-containing protein (putative c-di-GMP-specific phosphodiesterase class I)